MTDDYDYWYEHQQGEMLEELRAIEYESHHQHDDKDAVDDTDTHEDDE